MTALTVAGLSHRYRRTEVLHEVGFALPTGGVAALVGPNGAGKSTLLSVLAGLTLPTAGTVHVLGEPVRGALHPRAAYVPQSGGLPRSLTVAELLTMTGRLNTSWSAEAARALLTAVEVPLDRRAGALSDGTRALVRIALALGRQPDLLLLDEPLAALDPLARDEVLRALMAEVAAREVTVLLSSHVPGELREVCDHLVLLDRGRVRLAGDLEDLLAGHALLVGPVEDTAWLPGERVVHRRDTERQSTVLLRGPVADRPGWAAAQPDLESLVLGHLRSARAASAV
ncbi:ABC-2 type transport system ATP-binding protein [Crossiella equi]|uniref:ABC-2 type transport system ATP-binding protein n=1 Tax=Crossiella equi TaxID=130796 RepID=A0ABS5A794_9PSEU|nr:ABC transporter ATP-binding protein [Crossiella equi]MBP2471565.1 ABC-2 type transport system ATP-binding protein [Crossiella equi]